jgi:fructose/tagatose bisphosphate aldolase
MLESHPDFYGFVLHGGSSIAKDSLQQSRRLGVVKANFGSSVYRLFIETVDGLFPPAAAGQMKSSDLEPRKDLLKTFWTSGNYRSPDWLRNNFRAFSRAVQMTYFEPCGWPVRNRLTTVL